jgi:hypothetical protein
MRFALAYAVALLLGGCSIASGDHRLPTAAPATSAELLSVDAPKAARPESKSSPDAADPASDSAEMPTVGPNEVLEHVAIPKTRSPAPKHREWQYGKPVDFARDNRSCAGRLVREWLRIRCLTSVVGVSLLTGTRDDTSMQLLERGEGSAKSIEIVFPLRVGDRRVFQMTSPTAADEWGGVGETISAMISESWVDDDRGPIVVVGP